MKHLILKLTIILILIVWLGSLVSCSTEQKVHRIAKRNHCPAYKSAYLKWQHPTYNNHLMTKR